MSYEPPQLFKRLYLAKSGSLTGAAPQTGAGNTLETKYVREGTLSARLAVLATVNTLTLTAKWQCIDPSDDSTWIDVCGTPNNAANVVLVTGDGSPQTATVLLPAPDAVYAARQCRCVVVSGVGVAAGAASETYAIAYNFRVPTGY